jgi:hypothetical protein
MINELFIGRSGCCEVGLADSGDGESEMEARSGTASKRIEWVLTGQTMDPAEAAEGSAATGCRMRTDGCVSIKH